MKKSNQCCCRSAKEIAYLDTQSKIKTSAERVAAMNNKEKQEWIHFHRLRGNDFFHEGLFSKACDSYLEALAGLDLNGPDKLQVQKDTQVPITCNLIACMIKLEVTLLHHIYFLSLTL